MTAKIVTLIFLLVGTATFTGAAETVTFKSTSKALGEARLMLAGKLTKPQGDGPFPAVVLLHGCGGIQKQRDDLWAERLVSWGYAALQVDSFRPRGDSNVCANRSLSNQYIPKRAQDAYDAKSYLAGLPSVDRNRIAVVGWSHGGWSTLAAISPTTWSRTPRPSDPFSAAVVFYPYCDEPLDRMESPLLILIGGSDDWTPANLCQKFMPGGKTQHDVILKVYPGAFHGFDTEGLDRMVRGSSGLHQMRYDPAAAADAVVQVKNFLGKNLK